MPQAPAADQAKLLSVQELDTQAAQAQHRLASLPARARVAELEARLGELAGARIEAETAVLDIKRQVTKAEDDVQSVRSRAERDNARLAAGAGMTPKDLQALQAELEVLAKRQAALEEIELEAMQRLEDAEHVADGVVAEHAEVERSLAEARSTLAAEASVIEAELAQLAADRAAAATGLDEALVALYEKLRAAHGGVGAAALQRGACQGCHMSLNPSDLAAIDARPVDDIVRCEECGRILVRGA